MTKNILLSTVTIALPNTNMQLIFINWERWQINKKMKIIRVYGITGHGKGEVNYAGGLTKVAM